MRLARPFVLFFAGPNDCPIGQLTDTGIDGMNFCVGDGIAVPSDDEDLLFVLRFCGLGLLSTGRPRVSFTPVLRMSRECAEAGRNGHGI